MEHSGQDLPDTKRDKVASNHEHPTSPPERVRDADLRPELRPSTRPDQDGAQGRGTTGGLVQEPFPGVQPGAGPGQFAEITASYSGPVPMPEHLRQYNDLVPGSAERIIHSVYVEPGERQKQMMDAEIAAAKTGQTWAIILALVCIVAAIVFFALGNNVAGAAFLGLPIVGLIGSFLPKWRGRSID